MVAAVAVFTSGQPLFHKLFVFLVFFHPLGPTKKIEWGREETIHSFALWLLRSKILNEH